MTKTLLSNFMKCLLCEHEKVCKYCEATKGVEIEEVDIPVVKLQAVCSEFKHKSSTLKKEEI